MPKIIAMHDVDDVEFWLASPKRAEIFKDVAQDIQTFVHPDQPGKVGVSMSIPDMEAFMAVQNSPEGAAAMAHDGVRPETIVVMVQA